LSSTRLWVLVLAAVAYLAGIGSGVIISDRSHRHAAVAGAVGEFERAFIKQFDLDQERQRLLAGLLDHYNRNTQEIKDRYAAENHREMEGDLRRVGTDYRELLRERLLPEHQRPKFDRLMASYVENL
jgi:hypothetical protein